MSSRYQTRPSQMRPGWPEIATALTVYVLLLLPLLLWIVPLPPSQAVLRGLVGMAVNGIAGIIALGVTVSLRIRDLGAFGFRKVERHWLLVGAGLAFLAFGGSFAIESIYAHFITEVNTQADFQMAAKSGLPALTALVLLGGVLTPFGEEAVFRAVVANALNRYGAGVGIIGSAIVFAAIHGPSVIAIDAFMVGLMAGYAFRHTGSIWPGLTIHIVYNTLNALYYAI